MEGIETKEKAKRLGYALWEMLGGVLGVASSAFGFFMAGLGYLRDTPDKNVYWRTAIASLFVYALNMTWQKNKLHGQLTNTDLELEPIEFQMDEDSLYNLPIRIWNRSTVNEAVNVKLELMALDGLKQVRINFPKDLPLTENCDNFINAGSQTRFDILHVRIKNTGFESVLGIKVSAYSDLMGNYQVTEFECGKLYPIKLLVSAMGTAGKEFHFNLRFMEMGGACIFQLHRIA